jgi:hypothetical protein
VHELTVLERTKLDLILQELQLSKSGYVDPASAPRIGRLMGSSRLVTGSLLGIGDEGLRLEGAIVGTADSNVERTQSMEGTLVDVFRMEKDFVFSLIDELGIELTIEERDAIKKVPTESYLAFLAYCRGLDYERRGMNSAAKQEYAEALRQDGRFQQAQDRFDMVSRNLTQLPEYEASYQQFASDVTELDLFSDQQIDLLADRLSAVIQNVGPIPVSRSAEAILERYGLQAGFGTIIVRGYVDAPK